MLNFDNDNWGTLGPWPIGDASLATNADYQSYARFDLNRNTLADNGVSHVF